MSLAPREAVSAPAVTENDSGHLLMADAVFVRESASRCERGFHSDFFHLFDCQFDSGVRSALLVGDDGATFGMSIFVVIAIGAKEPVIWPLAGWVITGVQNAQVFGDASYGVFIAPSVGVDHPAFVPESSVSFAVGAPNPRPTPIGTRSVNQSQVPIQVVHGAMV